MDIVDTGGLSVESKAAIKTYVESKEAPAQVAEPLTFKQGFKTAREAGKKEFTFEGKRFTTNLAPAPVADKAVVKKPKTLYGKDAINRVIKDEGVLSDIQKYVVVHEGFVDGLYTDTKGITTSGVGQTGKYKDMTFKQTYDIHFQDAKRMVPKLDTMNTERQKAFMSLAYRGDLVLSPNFRDLVNEGKFYEASEELLDNDEYKGYKKDDPDNGIIHRLEEAAKFIRGDATKPKPLTFKEEFKTAKEAGKKEFTFKGKRYSTKQA